MIRLILASFLAAFLGLSLAVLAPAAASADGQIIVTRPDGGTPGNLFTDLTFVPGGSKTEELLVSQTTDEDVTAGIRFKATSPHGPLHDSAEMTITGFGNSVSAPLGEALDTEAPFWLGTLSPGDKETITVSVHLPESAGNDTKRKQARFQVIVTAQGEGIGPTPPPTDPPGDPTADNDASAESDGSSDNASDSASNTSSDSEASAESDDSSSSNARAASDSITDSDAGAEAFGSTANSDGSTDPGGDLPRTGSDVLISLVVAATLVMVGIFAVRKARRKGSNASTD